MSRFLVTGGAGFIGHHVVEHLLRYWGADAASAGDEPHVIVLDRLDTSGNLNRLADITGWDKGPRYQRDVSWVWHDLKAPISDYVASQIGPVDYVLHLAAGTHVDRSIADPIGFVMDNVVGTAHLLEFCRKAKPKRVVYFSTDEVFGSAPPGRAFREWDGYRSGNPYSATKAGAEELCVAYHNTYGVPVLITHCMNAFGERQHPEKFIPLVLRSVLDGKTVEIHADKSKSKAGSRFYIHARNVADAVAFVLRRGEPGEKYNIVGEREVDNLTVAELVAAFANQALKYRLVDFHSSRPGHDLRYALDGSKLAGMGWKPPVSFERALDRTVKWTLENPRWLL